MGDGTTALAGPSDMGTEYTLYMSTGPLLFRVTGVAVDGDPEPDVEQVMLGLFAGSIVINQREGLPPSAPEPTATVIPTATVAPTATFVPTATPVPTATLTPSPTPTPQPTTTPFPTLVPTPTPPLTKPAAMPTATPRVVRLPTVVPTPTATPPPMKAALATTPPIPVLGGPGAAPSEVEAGACNLVELYPGYPGYRGYVTGVDGPGDVACLQDLIAEVPNFDKSREDAANVAAAQAVVQPGRRFIGLATTAIQATARSHANVLFLPHSC